MNNKKKKRINDFQLIIFSLIVSFSLALNCFSNNYFVAVNGSNLNNGSLSAPFKSIKQGIDILNFGDTLYIREGIYFLNEQLKLKSNTHILAYKNEKVEIHGTQLKSEWVQISNNLWKCFQNDSVIQLFIEGKPYFQAAYPNISENINALKKGAFAVAYPTKEMFINGLEQFNNLTSARVIGLHGDGVVSLNGTIKQFNGNKITIENNAFYWKEQFQSAYLDTGMAVLTGAVQFMDTLNEWYWTKGELFLILDSNPNFLKIETRSSLYTFDCSNLTDCTCKGITFIAANLNLSNANNCKINNCNFTYPTPFFSFPDGFERFNYLLDQNNNVYFDPPEKWTGKGLTISGSNNTVENCYIAHSWGDGLTVWGKNHTIINNEIYDCDWIANDCAPLSITGSGHTIEHNTLHKAGRSILVHRKIENSKIKYNHLYDAGLLCEDLGITYCYDTDGKNTEIAYNYLHDNNAKKNGAALYIDNGNSNFNIHHNILANSLVGININKSSINNLIFNNTLYNNTYSMGAWGPDGTELKNVKTFNNITNTNKKAKWNYDAFYGTKMDSNHVYFDNNIFIDPENHNFNLKKYSYPIDKGITNEYTLPFKGKAPDLGAIESDSEPIVYGSSIIVENEQHYPPKTPLKLKLINNTPTTTVLAWEYPFNFIDSFYLERKISGDTFKIIAKLPALTMNYNDSNQPPGEYRFRVKALNKYGISDPSNSVEIFNPKYENSIFLDAENNDRNNGTNKSGDVIINNDNNDWICFKQVDYGTQNFDACIVNMAVPCEQSWQEIQLRIDRPMGRMIGNLTTTSTGGWDKFEKRNFPIEKISGKHDTYIKFKGNQGLGTIDWFNLYNSQGNIKKQYPTDPICPQQRNTSRLIPITIYPNPSSEELAVAIENLETSDINIKFASTEGILLLDKTETKQQPGTQEYYLHNHINISSLTKGIYHLQITITGKRVTQTKNYKFIKN